MTDAAPLLSPLHDRHEALGAKFGDFGGWSMPLEYAGGGVVAEHTAVRERVGVFDVSHLGKARVIGPGAAAYLDSVVTNALDRIAPGKAQYTLLCDETGGQVPLDLHVAFGHQLLVVAVGAPGLSQGEDMLWAVVADKSLRDRLRRRLDAPIA